MVAQQIAQGFYNALLKKEQSLYERRMMICRNCKLIKKDELFGEVCNGSLCLNKDTNETSDKEKEGYKCGCGCVLNSKTRVKEATCPVGK
jgi:hypothetical protein